MTDSFDPRSLDPRPFSWYGLGTTEGGLPVHLPVGVTVDGEGPTNDDEADRFECWCRDPWCPLTEALRKAAEAAARKYPAPDELPRDPDAFPSV